MTYREAQRAGPIPARRVAGSASSAVPAQERLDFETVARAGAMQTVACMRWGTLFPPDYVNRLFRGVMRNVSRPTRFIAFTDDATGLDPGVEARPIPPIRLPATGLGGSPWRKLALWSGDIGVAGDMLFLDLDVVVVGAIDGFFDFEPGKFAIIRDWGSAGSGNSSVMRIPAGGAPHLIERFEAAPLEKRRLHSNEQVYLTRESGLPTAFWPESWCPGFKAMMLPRFPFNLVKTVTLPEGARVVVFTGHPRPHEAQRGEWPAAGWKKIYKRVRPVTWLDAHWR
jgi:hypothetical protein